MNLKYTCIDKFFKNLTTIFFFLALFIIPKAFSVDDSSSEEYSGDDEYSSEIFSSDKYLDPEFRKTYHQLLKFNDPNFEDEPKNYYLSQPLNVNITNREGETLFHLAARKNDQKLLSILLKDHPELNVNLKDQKGNTAFHIALRLGHSKIAEEILKFDASCINIRNEEGLTAFESILYFGGVKLRKDFSSHTFNESDTPNLFSKYHEYSGATMLHIAAQYGDMNTLKELLLKHKQSNMPLKQKQAGSSMLTSFQSLFSEAIGDRGARFSSLPNQQSLRVDAAKDFSQKRLYVNTEQRLEKMTPLHCAARQGKIKAVKLLLEHGADVNAQTSYGETSLFAAVMIGNKKLVSTLLKSGANPNIPSSREKKYFGVVYPLHLALHRSESMTENDAEILKMLLDKKASVDVLAHDEPKTGKLKMHCSSPLHLAIQFGSKEEVELLLKAKANVELTDGDENNIFHLLSYRLIALDQIEYDAQQLARKYNSDASYRLTQKYMAEHMDQIKAIREILRESINDDEKYFELLEAKNAEGKSPFDIYKTSPLVKDNDELKEFTQSFEKQCEELNEIMRLYRQWNDSSLKEES